MGGGERVLCCYPKPLYTCDRNVTLGCSQTSGYVFWLSVSTSETSGVFFCVDYRHTRCRYLTICVRLSCWLSATVSEMSVIIPCIQDSLSLSLSLSLSIGELENDIPVWYLSHHYE